MALKSKTTESMAAQGDTAGVAEAHDAFAGLVTYQLFGTWVGTVTFQGTIDNSNWYSVRAEPLATGTFAATATGTGLFRVDASGLAFVRVKFTTRSSGTVSVQTTWVIG